MSPAAWQGWDGVAAAWLEALVQNALLGLLLVAATALLLRLLPRAGAALRFAVWNGALVAVVGSLLLAAGGFTLGPPAGTATDRAAAPTAAAPADVGAAAASRPAGPRTEAAAGGSPGHGAVGTTVYLPPLLASALLTLLLALAALGMARVARAYLQMRRLKRRSAPIPSLDGLMESCRRALGAPPVRLLSSPDVTTPILAGLNRPAVLLPRGMEDRFSREDLRCVLLHELAHLRRRDDWTLLLYALLRAALVFHPAVLWITNLLQRERELCCDEWVASLVDRRRYATCLTRIARDLRTSAPPALAAAALVRPHGLTERIEMLLRKQRLLRPRTTWPALALSLLVAAAVVPLATAGPWLQVAPQPAAAGAEPGEEIAFGEVLWRDMDDRQVREAWRGALAEATTPADRDAVLIRLSPTLLDREELREDFLAELASTPDDASLRHRLSGVLHQSWLSWQVRGRLVEIAAEGFRDEAALAGFLAEESQYLVGEPQLADRVREVAEAMASEPARRRVEAVLPPGQGTADGAWVYDGERGWQRQAAGATGAPPAHAAPAVAAGGLDELTTALGSGDPAVRAAAAFRLAALRSDAAPAVPALVALLGDDTPVRRRAGVTSQRWGGDLEAAATTSPAEEAAKALVFIGPPALAPLEAAMDDDLAGSEHARWALRLLRQSD